MQNIPRADGDVAECPPTVKHEKGFTFCAKSGDRIFAVKKRAWPNDWCRNFAIRHGTEFIYYVLAAHNQVSMPSACVLKVGGEQCWASEIVKGRDGLRLKLNPWSPGLQDKLISTLKNSVAERLKFLRTTFLDVLLLAGDRTEYNILKEDAGDHLRLYYIDHEQSCGWQSDVSTGGKIRIYKPEVEIKNARDRYVSFARQLGVKELSTAEERESVFREIALTENLLDEVRPMLPDGWVSGDQFNSMREGLVTWWKFLQAPPYGAIDAILFD